MKAVAAAGRKLAAVNKRRDEVLEELKAALREADKEGGHTRQDLWRASGVARQTVYDALREQQPPVPDPLTGAALPTEPPSEEQAAAEQAALDHPVGQPA